MPRFFIRILGVWRIETPRRLTDVRSPIERALLLMLATARARGVSCRRLVCGAWGADEAGLINPRDSLGHAISKLRAKLADTNRSIITYIPGTGRYRLDVADDELDYLTFVHHRDAAAALLEQMDDETGAEALSVAVEHHVKGLQGWSHDWPSGLPDEVTINHAVAQLNQMRTQLLRQYIQLVTGENQRHSIPLRSITAALLLDARTLPPHDFCDLFRRCDAHAIADLVDILLTTRHPHAEALFRMVNHRDDGG